MLKGNDLMGIPIVAYDTGETIKKVKDLIFDNNSQLLGFLVDENIWIRDTQVLPLHSVKVIGPDVIVASSETAIASVSRLPEIKQALERDLVMVGTKIVTEEGYDLGTIADLFFDKATGAIEGYEVKGGLFADPECGVSFVPAPQNLKIGDDVAFVPREIAEMMEEQANVIPLAVEPKLSINNSGVNLATEPKVIINQTNNDQVINSPTQSNVTSSDRLILEKQIHQTYQNASTPEVSTNQALENDDFARQESWTTLNESLSNPLSISSVEDTLGCRVRRSVKVQEGIYVAALGQIITEKVIARAKIYRQEKELMAAVFPPHIARRDRLLVKRQVVKSNFAKKKHANSLVNYLRNTLNSFQERNTQAAEMRKIKQAIGRPVNRVILDADDNIILDVGELITYKAIEKSRQANVLDILLGSVDSNRRLLENRH